MNFLFNIISFLFNEYKKRLKKKNNEKDGFRKFEFKHSREKKETLGFF